MDSEQTIQKYCGNIRDRIVACRSRSIAIALKKRLCAELQMNCESSMINNVLQEHVDNIIAETFNAQGKNRYLEESNEIF